MKTSKAFSRMQEVVINRSTDLKNNAEADTQFREK